MSESGNRDNRELTTLIRGLDVLTLVATSETGLTAKSIAKRLGLQTSPVYHVLRTLRTTGFIDRNPGGTLAVGPAAIELGRALQQRAGINHELSALLVGLRSRTRETVYITAYQNGEVILRECLESTQALAVGNVKVGYSEHPHARASAKAIFAHLPRRDLSLIFRDTIFERLTPATIGTYEDLLHDLELTRHRGYALDQEELHESVCCVSAPYFDAAGRPLGSFTVSAPATRFRPRMREFANAVMHVSTLATRVHAGGDGDHQVPKEPHSTPTTDTKE